MKGSYHSSNNTVDNMKKNITQRKIDALNTQVKKGVNKIKGISKEKRNSQIASFDKAAMGDFIENIFDPNSSLNVFKGFQEKAKPLFASDEKVAEPILKTMYKNNFFNNLMKLEDLAKSQTGTTLMKKTSLMAEEINYQLSSQKDVSDFQSMYDASKRLTDIKQNGGVIIDFDIESVGGANKYGHQQIDSITEISAKAMRVMPGQESKVVEDMTTVLGYSDSEYNKTKKYLESLKSKTPGELTNKDKVYLNRFSRIADPGVELKFGDGFEVTIGDTKKALSDKDLIVDVDAALAGLKRQREIGIHQENWIKSQQQLGNLSSQFNLEGYKNNYIKRVQDLVMNGIGVNDTYENALTIGHNIINFDNPQMARITGYNPYAPKNAILDTYQYIKQGEELLGQGFHYNGSKSIANMNADTKLHGSGTQDFLRKFFGIGDGQSHNAEIDVKSHFELVMNSEFGNKMSNNISKMNSNLGPLKGRYKQVGRQGVFYSGPTPNEGWGNRNNSMNFVYDPLNDSFKSFSGHSINAKTGEVATGDFGAWGPKAHALYEKSIFEIDMKGKWKEQFKAMGMDDSTMDTFFQQYGDQNKIFIVQSKEFIDKERLAKRYGDKASVFEYGEGKVYFEIFSDKEKIAPALGLKIGYKNEDGSLDVKEESLNALDLKVMQQDSNGNIVLKELDGDKALDAMLDRHVYRTTTDSAARTIREGSYTRFQSQRKFKQANSLGLSDVIAKAVSENRDLTMDITTPLIQELGWTDLKGNQKIIPERLTKATVLDEYVAKGDTIFAAMEKVFAKNGIDEVYDEITTANGYTVFNKAKNLSSEYAKRDFIFKQTLNNVMESLSNDPMTMTGGTPAIMNRFEANRIDFNYFDIFPEMNNKRMRANVANKSMDTVSINLTGNDALIKAFGKGRFDNIDIIPNSNAAYEALLTAYDTIGSDDRFEGIWKGLSKKKVESYRNGNLSVLNDEMMRRLRGFTNHKREVEKDTGFGYLYNRTVQDPSKMWDLLAGKSEEELFDLFNKHYAKVDNFMYLSDAAKSDDMINNIVDNYFMTFKEADLEKQIKGLTSRQQDIMRSNYKLAKRDAYARAQELLMASRDGGVDLVMNGQGKNAGLFLMNGSDIRKINTYKYTLTEGIVEANIGGNFYAVNHAYNTSAMVKNGFVRDKSGNLNIKVTNNIENSIDHMATLTDTVKRAKDGKRDILDDLIYQINRRSKVIREASPRREVFNHSNTIQRATKVDFNGLISILPELEGAGVIDKIIENSGMDENFAMDFKAAIKKMADGKRYRNLDEMFASEKGLYFQLFDATITDYVNNSVNFQDDITQNIFRAINSYGKNTNYVRGQKDLDLSTAHGGARFDKDTRPPIYQYGNTELYNKADIDKKIKANKKSANKLFEHVFNKSSVTTSASEKYIYALGKTEEYAGKTSGLTMKYLQASSNDLRNYILGSSSKSSSASNIASRIGGDASNVEKILTSKVKEMSTYEQQTLMNSRVFDVAFHKTNKQIISKKKQLLSDHADTVDVINKLNANVSDLYPVVRTNENGIKVVEYISGIEVKANQLLGVFGDENSPEKIKAKFDGMYRSRYYKDGHMVSQEELNNFIKEGKLKTDDEIIKALEENFDRRLEVVRKFQTYGQKVFNGTSEKSTTETLAMGVGTLDTELSNFLKAQGREDVLGNVLTADYEETFLRKFGDTKIGEKTFIERYFNEKHAFSDFLTGIEGLEDVSQFVALDMFKHKSVSMAIENGLTRMREEGMLNEKNLDVLFGAGNYSLNDGVVNFDNVKQININALKEFSPKAYKEFNKIEGINNLGHKGYSHVVQMRDDSAGTYAGMYLDGLDTDNYKGIKFSRTMNTTLAASKYDNDSIELARQRYLSLGLEDEFKSTFAHALNADGTIKDDYLGKSMLDPVLDRLRGTLDITPGQKLLSEVNDSRYNYLKKEFGEYANKISVDRAEMSYSYAQGVRALNFNLNNSSNGYSNSAYKSLVNEGAEHNRFTLVDLTKARAGVADDWLSLDVGGQGNTITSAHNNPYTNNIMIKYGPKESDVLAIARMPEKHFDDSLIKKDHISKITALQNKMMELNGGNYSTQVEKDRIQDTVRSIAEDIKVLQKKDITSKTGIAGEMTTVRLDQSFFGKGSGIVYNDIDHIKTLREVAGLSAKDKAERLTQLKNINSDSFSNALFKGKSLMEHYGEGKAVDNVFLSRKAFENMGYFENEFMENVFGKMDDSFGNKMKSRYFNASNVAGKQSIMEELLSTYGDSFISVRYPEIMEGSDKVVMGYLKSSLKDNQIQVVGHTGASMRLDHDGDTTAVARAKTRDGRSMIDYIVNREGADESLISYANAVESSMMKRATNENWYWDDQVRKRLALEADIAKGVINSKESMIEIVGKDKMIDGRLISSMLDLENDTISNYEGYRQKYIKQLEMQNHEAAVDSIKSTIANDMKDSTVEQIAKAQELAINDYGKAFAYQTYRDEIVAKASNQAIGEINATNAKIKNALSSLMDTTDENYKYNQITGFDLFHVAEEAAISAKSSIEGLSPNRAKEWNEMTMKLILGEGNEAQLKQGMMDWGKENMVKDMRFDSYFDSSVTFQKKAAAVLGQDSLDLSTFQSLMENKKNKAAVSEMVINDFVENIATLRSVDNVDKVFQQLSIGQSSAGVKMGTKNLVTFEGFDTNYDGLISAIQNMTDLAKDFETFNMQEKIRRESYIDNNIVSEILTSSERNTGKKSLSHAILEGAGDLFKGIGSSGIAMGALGIAAGIMAVGYVGGRPRPADVHAMEEAQDFQAPMDGHSVLADPGLAFQQGGMNGYVVNINARTDKSREHAISAIQQAINSGTSSNINVSMNINDNYGNINDRDLERALADVLR